MAGGWVGAPPAWGCCAVDSEKVELCESGMQSGSCWLVKKLTSWPVGVGLFWVLGFPQHVAGWVRHIHPPPPWISPVQCSETIQ